MSSIEVGPCCQSVSGTFATFLLVTASPGDCQPISWFWCFSTENCQSESLHFPCCSVGVLPGPESGPGHVFMWWVWREEEGGGRQWCCETCYRSLAQMMSGEWSYRTSPQLSVFSPPPQSTPGSGVAVTVTQRRY